jgi:hypothetical protein
MLFSINPFRLGLAFEKVSDAEADNASRGAVTQATVPTP